MDIEHLIEELDGMARSDKRELESRFTVLISTRPVTNLRLQAELL